MRRTTSWSLALLVAAAGAACSTDAPTAPATGGIARAMLVLVHDDEHGTTCNGLAPTIWPGMDPTALPPGASITPQSHEGEEHGGYVITGTAGPDVILGSEGRDEIHGLVGDDVLCGGGAPDVIHGDAGDDIVVGGGGPDRIYGGTGNDLVDGKGGPDQVQGEAGDDTLNGGPGCDLIEGGYGDDWLYGQVGNDRLFGGPGDDWLDGGTGLDELDGGLGENVLVPGDQTPDEPGEGGHDPGEHDEGGCS